MAALLKSDDGAPPPPMMVMVMVMVMIPTCGNLAAPAPPPPPPPPHPHDYDADDPRNLVRDIAEGFCARDYCPRLFRPRSTP
jgi:hypothetical protein